MPNHGSVEQPSNSFSTLECGHAYYIKLNDAGSYDCAITHATLSAYGESGESAPSAFRITDDCTTGSGGPSGAEFAILETPITETLLEGYDHTGTPGNAEEHTGIITTATDIHQFKFLQITQTTCNFQQLVLLGTS